MNLTTIISSASFGVKAILLILFIILLINIFLIGKKRYSFNRINRNSNIFEKKFWSGVDISKLYEEYKSKTNNEGLSSLFIAGFTEFKKIKDINPNNTKAIIENCERAIKASIIDEINKQESYLKALGTSGAISPYIGLVGTVYGIMNTFIVMGEGKSLAISNIAPHIAEALIVTGVGLFVAIIAVSTYNYFINKSEKLTVRYEIFSEELINIINRNIL